MRFLSLIVGVALALLVSGMTFAAPSFLGTTGNIMTPDDLVLDPGDFAANFHSYDFNNDGANVIGANIGVAENLELGIARLDPEARGADNRTVISGKYRVLPETVTRPSVVIGVIDLGGELDPEDDPSFYVVIGKNLTPAATGITGEPVQPIKGFVGVGGGIYKGFFAGVSMAITPRVSVMGEYINEVTVKNLIDEDSVFNVGMRVALTDKLRGDIALIDGEDLAFGISYIKLGL
jgi:hypothetical protein